MSNSQADRLAEQIKSQALEAIHCHDADACGARASYRISYEAAIDELAALAKQQASPEATAEPKAQAQAGGVGHALLNRLIELGSEAAYAHAQSNSDDGHAGTEAWSKWHALREEMGRLIASAMPTSTHEAPAVPAALTDEHIIIRCEAAGMKWLPPFDAPAEEGGFKGAFDLSDIDSLRKLLTTPTERDNLLQQARERIVDGCHLANKIDCAIAAQSTQKTEATPPSAPQCEQSASAQKLTAIVQDGDALNLSDGASSVVPELLAALKKCRDILEANFEMQGVYHWAEFIQAEAAIDKATAFIRSNQSQVGDKVDAATPQCEQAAAALDDVFKATAANGETCHFGTERGATIWAGTSGKVERIALRNLSLVAPIAQGTPPAAGGRTCSDERPCIPCYTDKGECLGPAVGAGEVPPWLRIYKAGDVSAHSDVFLKADVIPAFAKLRAGVGEQATDHKPIVQRIMDLARRFRSAPGSDYDVAYKEFESFAYGALRGTGGEQATGGRTAAENGGKTGSPPGLLQDDCKGLSQWLASRPDALRRVREACIEIEAQQRAEAGIKEKT